MGGIYIMNAMSASIGALTCLVQEAQQSVFDSVRDNTSYVTEESGVYLLNALVKKGNPQNFSDELHDAHSVSLMVLKSKWDVE